YGDGDLGHLVLPALTLGALHTGTVARMTRSSLLEVVRLDYVQAARAKGLGEWAVLGKHALRNALIPVVTVIGIGLADLLVAPPPMAAGAGSPRLPRRALARLPVRARLGPGTPAGALRPPVDPDRRSGGDAARTRIAACPRHRRARTGPALARAVRRAGFALDR